ncbi:MAG: hypothetical protein IPG23_01155 [Burkholderiales bacterium]|nr:hypothetical protein [Burkholderiales bacterium]
MYKTAFSRHLGQLAIALSLLGLTGLAHSAPDTQFQSAFQQFMQANSGDSSAIHRAAEAFATLYKNAPSNPVLLAYTGAATAMRATTTMLPWKKMGFAEDGLGQLDKALAMLNPAHDAIGHNGTPSVLDVKFLAANTFLAVPGFMNRHDRGNKLLGEVLASPLLATAPLGFRGSVWMKAAREATKAHDAAQAKRYLGLIVQEKAPQAAQAQTMLSGLSS